MSEQEMTRHDQVLLGLVFSLQAGAMQQLGKMPNQMNGAMDKDLGQAKSTIDVLEMLKVKCRIDTPADVLRIIDSAVMDLQMHYMDEVKKAEEDGQEPNEQKAGQADEDSSAEADG